MITLKMDNDNELLINYLNAESENIGEGLYKFYSIKRASEVISWMAIYLMKENEVSRLIKEQKITQETKDMYFMHLSDKMIQHVIECTKQQFLLWTKTETHINFNGFYRFTLKNEREMMKKEMEKAYEVFGGKEEVSGSEYFKKMMENQEPLEDEVVMTVDSDRIEIKGENNIYFSEKINEDDYEAEDGALSHIIVISPNFVKVYDQESKLSKQTVVILNEIFKEKVMFFREKHT